MWSSVTLIFFGALLLSPTTLECSFQYSASLLAFASVDHLDSVEFRDSTGFNGNSEDSTNGSIKTGQTKMVDHKDRCARDDQAYQIRSALSCMAFEHRLTPSTT